MFGYNAIVDKSRRQAPRTATKSEDVQLKAPARKKMIATSRDQLRNHTILAWMVRRHLDYVSRFFPHIRTDNAELNKMVIQLLQWDALKSNFDIAGRHDRDSFMRLFEMCKTLDGDCGILKIKSGHLQAIESDRIVKSGDIPAEIAKNVTDLGLVLDNYGRTVQYAIANRGKSGDKYEFAMMAKAEDMLFDGYFTRFDQTRGISPLATALNMSQDLNEIFEYNAIKAKVHSLFGLAFMRKAPTGMSYPLSGDDGSGAVTDGDPYNVSYNSNGILTLDLDPGDKVDTIESKTPSTELLNFTQEEIRIVLLALDIPFTAYDSMKSSFSARIADRSEYEESAEEKRRKNQNILKEYTLWKVQGWATQADKLAPFLGGDEFTPEWLAQQIEWIPAGTPWLDKGKEVSAEKGAIAGGLQSTPRATLARGIDAYALIDEQADYLAYAKSKNVPIYYADSGQEDVTEDEIIDSGTTGVNNE